MHRFCLETGRWPQGPHGWSVEDICCYIAWVSQSCSYATVDNYLTNGPRLYHKLLDLPWDDKRSSYMVQLTLRGVRRIKGDARPGQKLPITPELLLGIRAQLDFRSLDDITLWAACLTAFFGFLRKSNYAPESARAAPDPHILRRCDVSMAHPDSPGGPHLRLSLRMTKTIQFQERVLNLSLPCALRAPLDPFSAMWVYMSLTARRPAEEFLFGVCDPRTGAWRPMTDEWFISRVRAALSRAFPGTGTSRYGTHSFRRGGATYALRAGVSPVLIRLQGDWRSESFYDYCSVDEELREIAADLLAGDLCTRAGVTVAGPAPSTSGGVAPLSCAPPLAPQ